LVAHDILRGPKNLAFPGLRVSRVGMNLGQLFSFSPIWEVLSLKVVILTPEVAGEALRKERRVRVYTPKSKHLPLAETPLTTSF
jgi:hypothetical protein